MPGRNASSTIRRFSSSGHERRETFTLSLVSGNALNLHVLCCAALAKCPLFLDGHLPILTMTMKAPISCEQDVGGHQSTLTAVVTTFWPASDKFMVRSDGPDGALHG